MDKMKLLLTSNGIMNETLKKTLIEMVGKPLKESVVCYIPTAAVGDWPPHDWVVKYIKKAHDLGWKEFHNLEINGMPRKVVKERLGNADVIYAEGGNLYHLANSIIDNELEDIASRADFPIYAIDDDTAMKVVDGEMEIVSEGKWRLLNG